MADDLIGAVRRFNRFYTRAIGVLENGHLGSAYSLAETRVLYEIATRGTPTPKEVMAVTGLDRGYLSRIIGRLERDDVAERAPTDDARTFGLTLTPRGQELFDRLQTGTVAQVEALVSALDGEQRSRLIVHLMGIERLLNEVVHEPIHLRDPHVGDIGWVVQRHGVIYQLEYGWDVRFEALCARLIGEFFERFDPARERGWIAERGGENIGCIFLQEGEANTAKLRLLLVEPSARGLGLGRKLVEACITQAREFGYDELILWTQNVLAPARRLYAACGFQLVETWPNQEFADLGLTSETWRLPLRGGEPPQRAQR